MELDELKWIDVKDFGVTGKGWTDTESPYNRFPARAKDIIRKEVWNLSLHPSGLRVHFTTDSNVIAADWTLPTDEPLGSDHMPAVGKSGLDLYVRHKSSWRWVGVGRLTAPGRNRRIILPETLRGRHQYLLYLPLYNRLESLSIGIVPKASLSKPKPQPGNPIVFYGTSIVQGGCASRPGMTYPAILGRRLDRPFINLGFSGNARLEPEIASLLIELDPPVYVLDPLPNVPVDQTAALAEPFIRTLRSARPKTPIVLVENITYQHSLFVKSVAKTVQTRNRAFRKVFLKLSKERMKYLHYVPGADLLGHDGEPTVDGVHFSDLGFTRMADALEPVLRKLL